MLPLRKWLRLSAGERWLLLQSWLLLSTIRVALSLLPFRLVQSLLARGAARPDQSLRRISAEQIGWAVSVASVYVPCATCLPQALAAQTLLRHYQYPADLKIGVTRDGEGRLEAHAWIESAGQIVIGGSASSLARYTPLPALPPEKASC